ncbi:MAG TPA: preprotein translocase subunit SecG [bacterium]
MDTLLIIIHFIITILLTIVILLQSSKGGGLAGVFGGGGGMGTVFGGRGAGTFLSKLTTILATLFLVLSLIISNIDKGKSVDQGIVSQEREKRRMSSPAAVLPTVPGVDGETFPAGEPASSDTGK